MTPIQGLPADPTRAQELFAQIAATGSGAVKTRNKLFAELKSELDAHPRLEREHLLPLLEGHEATRDLAPAVVSGLDATDALIAEIDALPREGDEFAAKVVALKKLFGRHLRDEKHELLPAVQKAISEQQAASTQGVEAAVEQTEAATEQVAEQTLQAAEAVTEAAEANVQAAGQAVESNLRTAQTLGERSIERLCAVGQQSTDAFASTAREWTTWAQRRFQRRAAAATDLMACRTPADLIALQTRLVRDEVEQLLDTTTRVAQIASGAAAQTARAFAPRA